LILEDALSSGKSPKIKSATEQEISIRVNVVKKIMLVSDDMWRTIAEETDKDETLHQVKTNIINCTLQPLSQFSSRALNS